MIRITSNSALFVATWAPQYHWTGVTRDVVMLLVMRIEIVQSGIWLIHLARTSMCGP